MSPTMRSTGPPIPWYQRSLRSAAWETADRAATTGSRPEAFRLAQPLRRHPRVSQRTVDYRERGYEDVRADSGLQAEFDERTEHFPEDAGAPLAAEIAVDAEARHFPNVVARRHVALSHQFRPQLFDHVGQRCRDQSGNGPHVGHLVAPQEVDRGRRIELVPFHASAARHIILLSFDEDAVAETVRGRQGIAEQMRGFERDRVDHVYPRLSTLVATERRTRRRIPDRLRRWGSARRRARIRADGWKATPARRASGRSRGSRID